MNIFNRSKENSNVNKFTSPVTKGSGLFSLWLPVVKADSPAPPERNIETRTKITKLYTPPPGETGWDRLKAIYSLNVYGQWGPELEAIRGTLFMSLVTGGIYGVITEGGRQRDKFIEKNEGTLFANEMAGRRALQDRMTIGGWNGAIKWGLKTTIFTGIFVTTVTHISVYLNETYFATYVAAGCLTGGIYKFLQGPKAFLVGGLVGGILGSFAGACSKAAFALTGTSLEEMRYYHYQVYSQKKREMFKSRYDVPLTETKSVTPSENNDVNANNISKDGSQQK